VRKTIRRSQLVSPWGVAAMVDFPGDESLMVCGLDAWPFAGEDCPPEYKILEERLQARVRVNHFRLPPDYQLPGPGVLHPNLKVPCVRFPLWHFCPRCGNMRELAPYGGRQRCDGPNFADGRSCHQKPERSRPWLVPVRFVAACDKGHIRDFPWIEWVHRDNPATSICRMRLRAGRSASLAGIRINCTCGQGRTLAGSFDEQALHRIGVDCAGQRPWLGDVQGGSLRCGQELRVVQRGASNVYFAHVVSSIYLPLWGEHTERSIAETLEDPTVWSILSQGTVNGKIDPARCETVALMRRVDPEKLRAAAQRKLDGEADIAGNLQSEEVYRQAEYEALEAGRGSDTVDLFSRRVSGRQYGEPLNSYVHSVSLVHKLRETRAFVGFSRIIPDTAAEGGDKLRDLKLDNQINWLPAVTVRGEGIFLVFDHDRLRHWAGRARNRVERLARHYNEAATARGRKQRIITPEFVLLHTFAHLLINQLSFDCGYGSSSLRERLYCDAEFPEFPMAGVLIYTASGDSEGTLGGLVRQGEPGRLENTTIRALRTAAWCSSDPVCFESSGQGPDSCNLAACHSCALLPETSCEEGNRLLDRVVVVGSPKTPELGFFSE